MTNSPYNPASFNPRETSRPPPSATAKTASSKTVNAQANPHSEEAWRVQRGPHMQPQPRIPFHTDKRVTAESMTPVNESGTPFEDY